MSDKPRKVFEDWEEVDCNECEHYYDNSCDGVKKGSKIPCNSFLATRSVVIPQQIKVLKKGIRRLKIAIILSCIIDLIFLWILYC